MRGSKNPLIKSYSPSNAAPAPLCSAREPSPTGLLRRGPLRLVFSNGTLFCARARVLPPKFFEGPNSRNSFFALAPPLVPLPLSSTYPRNAPFFLLAFVLVCKVCVGAYSVERRKKGVLLSAGARANERGTDVWHDGAQSVSRSAHS